MGTELQPWIPIAELVLKIVVAIAAAVWAVALLFLLRQREQAQTNLRKSEAEIRDLDVRRKHVEAQILDLELKTRQAVIVVDIKSAIHDLENAHVILAVVEITNCGSQNAHISWTHQEPAFSVRRVKLGSGGQTDYDLVAAFRVRMTRDPRSEARSHVVRAGGKESLPFAVQVPSPGVYLLSFRGAVDEKDRIEAAKLGVHLPVAWTGSSHVVVGNPQVAETVP